MMYRRLLPLVNKYIVVRQGMLSRAYAGRLLNVDQECLELQTFHVDGTPGEIWIIRLDSITEFMTESRQLDTLALKVKWATSKDAEEADLPEGLPSSSISTPDNDEENAHSEG